MTAHSDLSMMSGIDDNTSDFRTHTYDPDIFLPWKGKYWKPGCESYFKGTDMKPRHVVIYNLVFFLKRILIVFFIAMY